MSTAPENEFDLEKLFLPAWRRSPLRPSITTSMTARTSREPIDAASAALAASAPNATPLLAGAGMTAVPGRSGPLGPGPEPAMTERPQVTGARPARAHRARAGTRARGASDLSGA